MKLQHIAAAVALVAAGAANATIADIQSGNSSLFLIAYDNANGNFTTTSSLLDLGYVLTDFTTGGLAGTNNKIVWDFGNNTIVRNGSLVSSLGTNAWDVAFDKLVANSDAGEIKWLVGAGDKVGAAAALNYLTTGTPTAGQLTSQTSTSTTGMGLVNDMYASLTTGAGKGTLNSAGNGGFTFAAADGLAANRTNGYIVDSTAFGTNWKGNNAATSSVITGSQNNFWLYQGNGTETRLGNYTLAAGETLLNGASLLNNTGTMTFNVAAKTLTWETAAVTAVPEASSYALALTGLVLAGMAARRRRA